MITIEHVCSSLRFIIVLKTSFSAQKFNMEEKVANRWKIKLEMIFK